MKTGAQVQERVAKKVMPTKTPLEVPHVVAAVLHSLGEPLDAKTRAAFETSFARDFSGVRVHTDPKAAESARAVDARAYTIGQEVVFDSGLYATQSLAGRQLLAHELTHVVQQQIGGAAPEITQMAAHEHEADSVSRALMSGTGRVRVTEGTAVGLARASSPAPVSKPNDVENLRLFMLDVFSRLSDESRSTILGNVTIAIAIVVDDTGTPQILYTTNNDWTNAELTRVLQELGIERWESEFPHEGKREDIQAANDAEQIMTTNAANQGWKVRCMAVSRKVCKHCKEAISTHEGGTIRVVEVEIPDRPFGVRVNLLKPATIGTKAKSGGPAPETTSSAEPTATQPVKSAPAPPETAAAKLPGEGFAQKARQAGRTAVVSHGVILAMAAQAYLFDKDQQMELDKAAWDYEQYLRKDVEALNAQGLWVAVIARFDVPEYADVGALITGYREIREMKYFVPPLYYQTGQTQETALNPLPTIGPEAPKTTYTKPLAQPPKGRKWVNALWLLSPPTSKEGQ